MTKRDECQVAGNQHGPDSCHASPVTCHISAFTLVELLTVIAIIAILAALLLPALSAGKVRAQKTQARLQIQDLVQQIQNYESQYSRMPISPAAQMAALNNGGMFTYGGLFPTPSSGTWPQAPLPANYYPSNTELIAILMDITNTTVTAVNANHQKNPQQTIFLNAKMVSDPSLPGVGPDLNYRDPWRNPYVITLDLNDDNSCKDPLYSLHNVSYQNPQPNTPAPQQGYNGLVNPTDPTGTSDNFLYHGNVMVWSAGPDGKIDPLNPADSGVNKDNIISWQ